MWFKPQLDHHSGSHSTLGESAAFAILLHLQMVRLPSRLRYGLLTVGPASQDFSIHKTVGR